MPPSARRFITWFTNLYPVWTIAVAVLGLVKPSTLVWFNPYVVAALGFVMLNMGLTLSVDDFKRLGKMPGSVAVGFTLHYTIMPLAAVPAVFSAFIQTIVGSAIATWWRAHPVEDP